MNAYQIRVKGSDTCPKCGQVHAVDASMAYEAANGSHPPVDAMRPVRRMTASEAMAFSKARYAKTLEHLA